MRSRWRQKMKMRFHNLYRGWVAAALFVCVSFGVGGHASSIGQDKGWAQVPEILSRIKAPTFPNREFKITDFGAVADGTTDNTVAIRKAVVACNAMGGGRVVVTPGVFLTGAIHLKSNV